MDYPSLIIGAGGLLLTVLAYFAGVQRGKRYRKEDWLLQEATERRRRIEQVVERYLALALAHPPIDSGQSALIKAGVSNLRDDSEISEALSLIADRAGGHPLGRRAADIERDGLKVYFDGLDRGR